MSNPFDNKDGLRGWPDDSPIVPNTSEPKIAKRPLPRGWGFRQKVNELKDKLSKRSAEHPEDRIRVVSKRGKEPHLGDWHTPRGQLELETELFSEKRCVDCGKKMIKASGELIGNPGRCGGCNNARQEAIDHPPAA